MCVSFCFLTWMLFHRFHPRMVIPFTFLLTNVSIRDIFVLLSSFSWFLASKSLDSALNLQSLSTAILGLILNSKNLIWILFISLLSFVRNKLPKKFSSDFLLASIVFIPLYAHHRSSRAPPVLHRWSLCFYGSFMVFSLSFVLASWVLASKSYLSSPVCLLHV